MTPTITVHALNNIEINGQKYDDPVKAAQVDPVEVMVSMLVYEGEILQKVSQLENALLSEQRRTNSLQAQVDSLVAQLSVAKSALVQQEM